jgi:adenine-specific DNA-methyltransferase
MSKHDDLVQKLKEIFQIDRPELDFGVYRILNARAGEITDYLENRLKAKVAESLAATGAANLDGVQKELKEKEAQYRADGIDPDTVPKVRELKQKLAEYTLGTSEHENAVFSHLLTFFSRYYDNGDFISQRRYKGDTYAIPYAGEEVMLHWANKDQYYTKSGENFSNFAFKLDDGRSVRFRLIAADTAKDNRKDNDKERRFQLVEPHTRTLTDDEGDDYEESLEPVEEIVGADGTQELVLRFAYVAMPKGTKQDALVLDAVNKVLADEAVKARWLDLGKREPTGSNPQRTLLEKHLTSYTTKNTADYFIHKDLGAFLRRELDFYIKNEVMHLDDVQHAEKFADIEKNLRLIQTLRAIALDLVSFLAQLEDFQKKLWLKKKFVVATHYCVTLDRVPESLYPAIAANPAQWEQWEKLGLLDGKKDGLFSQAKAGSVEYLKAHPYLMADTTLFDATFKNALLAAMHDLDKGLDGLLVHGDNFQALNLLTDRFRGEVDSVYIDPPYNTDAAPISYKNGYKDSSWLSLLGSRLQATSSFMKPSAVLCVTIDDVEVHNLRGLFASEFSGRDLLGVVGIKNNPAGRTGTVGFSICHEYALFYGRSDEASIGRLEHSAEQKARYKEHDDVGYFEWTNFRKHGGVNTYKTARPRQFYPIYLHGTKIRIPRMEWDDGQRVWKVLDPPSDAEQVLLPIDDAGRERIWDFVAETAKQNLPHFQVKPDSKGKPAIYRKWRLNDEGLLPQTLWDKSQYSAAAYGTNLLADYFGETHAFTFPKSLHAVVDCLKVSGLKSAADGGIALDYFGGSATTGHAVVSLNRQDAGTRKYILVEQGEYFDTVTKPRMQKVVYSADWKGGKAIAPQTGISHAFKVLKLESYEDTLNNLQLRRTAEQQSLLDSLPKSAAEDYLLRYLLDIESRGSLLSVEQFNQPFDCKLKVAVDSAGAYEEKTIDLVETFNYLIGLRVKHIDVQREQGFVSITGWLPTGEKTLVLWRDVEKVDYEALTRICNKLAINPADSEFEIVYINGDHNIPSVFTNLETEGGITKTLKLRQIEPEFLQRMFATEDA